jgi:small subunit ribosomal protein S16
MVKIRLAKRGRKHQPSYRIIAVDSRKKRDTGNYLEDLGYYNPRTEEAKLNIEGVQKWLNNGAQPTPKVKELIDKSTI